MMHTGKSLKISPNATAAAIEVKLISTRKEFLSLENDWRTLAGRCRTYNLFTSFDWMLTWWDCLGKDKELMVFVLRSSGSVIGIAPLMKIRKSIWPLKYNEVYFISATEAPYSPSAFAGTLDFIIPDEFSMEYEEFLRYLLSSVNGWHCLRLHPLPQNSPALPIFDRLVPGLRHEFSTAKIYDNACLNVAGSWTEYYAARSAKFRKNLRRARQNLTKRYPVAFVEYRTPQEMTAAYAQILQIEEQAWKWTDGSRINDRRYHDFYPALIRKFAEKNQTRIWILQIDGQPAAYDMHIQDGKSIKTLKGSYSQKFAEFSPGSLLSYTAHKRFFQEGIQHIDLLWGNLEYKQKWTNALEPHFGVCIRRKDTYSRLLQACEQSPVLYKVQQKYRQSHRWVKKKIRP